MEVWSVPMPEVTPEPVETSRLSGLQRERAGRATTVGYLQIVFATLWGVLVFGDRPGPATAVGAGIIVASTVMLTRVRR